MIKWILPLLAGLIFGLNTSAVWADPTLPQPLSGYGFGPAVTATEPPIATIKSSPTFSWEQPGYSECTQWCLYQKANENLSLQAVYSIRKYDALKELDDDRVAHGDDDNTQERDLLGGFCIQDIGKQKGESLGDCFNRFRLDQAANLEKIKAAIVKNESAAAALMENTSDPKHPPAPILLDTVDPVVAKRAQTPYIPTIQDIMNEDSRLSNSIRNVALVPVGALLPEGITPGDFVEYSSVPRDPNNPSSGNLDQIVTKADGVTPELDASGTSGYAKFLKGAQTSDGTSYQQQVLDEDNKLRDSYGKEMIVLQKPQPIRAIEPVAEVNFDAPENLDKEIFAQAHDDVVATVNKDFAKAQAQSQLGKGNTSGKLNRLIAGTQLGMSQIAPRAPEANADNDFYTVGLDPAAIDSAIHSMVTNTPPPSN